VLLDLFTSPWFSCTFLGLLVPWHPPLSLPGFFPTISISLYLFSPSRSADPNSSLYCWNLAFCFDWSDKCCDYCVLTCLLIIIELLVFLDLEELLVGFVRHLMLLMASKQGAPILPVPLESSLTMVIHSFPLASDCVWDCSQGFTCKVELLLGSCHVVKFFNVWFAFLYSDLFFLHAHSNWCKTWFCLVLNRLWRAYLFSKLVIYPLRNFATTS